MPDLPPYIWYSIAGVLFLLFLRITNKNFRSGVRHDFITFIQADYPEFTLVAEKEHYLLLRRGSADEQLFLRKVYASVASAKTRDPRQRRRIFKQFVDALLEQQELINRELTLTNDGDRIMARLVTPAFVDGLSRKIKGKLPHTPLSELGLCVVYVLDATESVVYLTPKHQSELGLDLAALHARAIANLAKNFRSEAVRNAVENKTVNLVKNMDSFDAARMLLVPKHLKESESVAACIPDRDTLVLCGVPPDDDWSALIKMARTADGDPLLNRPIKVTAGGFELI
jgi:hypothetical protein